MKLILSLKHKFNFPKMRVPKTSQLSAVNVKINKKGRHR